MKAEKGVILKLILLLTIKTMTVDDVVQVAAHLH